MVNLQIGSKSSSRVFKLRVVFSTIFFTSIAIPSLYQSILELLWDYLKTSTFYQWSTFETIWTVACYTAIESLFLSVFDEEMTVDFKGFRSEKTSNASSPVRTHRNLPRGMRRPSRRKSEALTYIFPLILMDLTMIKKFANVPLSAMLSSGNYDPGLLLQHPEPLTNSTLSTPFLSFGSQRHTTFLLPTLHNFTLSSPLQTHRALPPLAPTSRRLAVELVASFIIYDALFFLFHLVLHALAFLRPFHAPHHSHYAQLQPQITNQLSVFERLGLVLLANFSLNIIGAHVLTRTLFAPVFVWLLVEIHAGMELPWGYEKMLPAGWGGGAAKHARHHVTGKGGFEPFFGLWDALFERVVGMDRI
ncbi:hypothetical protein BU16DRAFT_575518 [Lophium mytilinum]|uniref:Fatty acid hydroxylase domain-containing protein n=1 Tax=Lophium mytilinum TaxID=390894 RepID=A0A6A6QEH6_9PEZI|nr:hypothetical protein BU16DRAFT_575518 [Lophium mytilinum]